MIPQPMRAPELPAGWDVRSSGAACTTMARPRMRSGPLSIETPPIFLDLEIGEVKVGSIGAGLDSFSDALQHGTVDSLAGKETYPAGRYLEPEALPGNRFFVDFNLAYNPYCAYNDDWSCPLTPVENWLPVPIRAGEKLFHQTKSPAT